MTREDEDAALAARMADMTPRNAAITECVAKCIRLEQINQEIRDISPVDTYDRAVAHGAVLAARRLAKDLSELME